MTITLSSLLQIDRESSDNIVDQLVEALRRLISEGKLVKGYQLPSSRALAKQLGVSRNTITFAVEQLSAEGYLQVNHGRRPLVSLNDGLTGFQKTGYATGEPICRPRLAASSQSEHQLNWPPNVPEPMLPLKQGRADGREFPHDAWARCLRRAARKAYDTDEISINRPALRVALSEHLSEHRGVAAEPEQIFLMPTAQAGLNLIAKLVLRPGAIAWTENPGYPGAVSAFDAQGAQVIGVELDADGIKPDPSTPSPTAIFTTPTHQFPTGRLMSVNRRMELLDLAVRQKSWIIEDDYDGELHYDERPVPALQGLDQSNRVFYLGTFSKATFAHIRVGYVVAPLQTLEAVQTAQLRDGLLAPVVVQDALADFIMSGHYRAHIRKVRRLYRDRRDHLANSLRHHLGEDFDVECPQGGMQLVAWCKAKTANDRALAERLLTAGVVARPVSEMYLGLPKRQGLLLGFAAWRHKEIDDAIGIMRKESLRP